MPTNRAESQAASTEQAPELHATHGDEKSLWSRSLAAAKSARPSLAFLAIWALLNAFLNARYPGDEPAFWYLIPSLDVSILFLYFAIFRRLGWRVPAAVRGLIVVWLFLVRFLRLGDGVQEHYYSQRFNLYTDLPLVPELVRFAHSTLPWWQFSLLVPACVLGLAWLARALYRWLAFAEEYLGEKRHVALVGGVSAVSFVLVQVVGHLPEYNKFFRGGFAVGTTPRLMREARFLLNVYGAQAEYVKTIAATERELKKSPTNLAKLAGKNVHLILVESYGQTVHERALYLDSSRQTFDRFEQALGAEGFSIVSGVLDSPTYGGHSWLAHATIGTGVKTSNQLEYDLICSKKPKTLATVFREAGYRTVLAQPGTTRPWPKGEFYNFDQKYYLWNFEYAGPSYSWATMPDQYVLDFVRRRESGVKRSLFVQYVLVSSHAPWSDIPTPVEDWSKLGNGAIFSQVPTTHYPIVWPNFANASEAYIHSIKYDFEILTRFLVDYVKDDSLIVILGDHQPVAEVNEDTDSHAVPVHVISRNRALLEPFLARGYTPGVHPHRSGACPGLETFMPHFVKDFSN